MSNEIEDLKVTIKALQDSGSADVIGVGVSVELAAELLEVHKQASDPMAMENFLIAEYHTRVNIVDAAENGLEDANEMLQECGVVVNAAKKNLSVIHAMLQLVREERRSEN